MPPGDRTRPAPAQRPSDVPPSRPAPAEADPHNDLAGALHEVSNALAVLLGWVGAARAATEPAAVQTALGVVASRASQARDIARRAIGGAATHAAPTPVAALVSDVVLALSMEARRAHIALDAQVDAEVAALHVSSGPALLQVLTNLLLNALAFSPRGSTVRIEAAARPSSGAEPGAAPLSQEASGAASAPRAALAGSGDVPAGPWVLLRVEDEGPGVPLAMRDRLFEGGVTSRPGGAGIGLRHSAALAARAGGELRLGTTERGTRFDLLWPASEVVVASDPAKRPSVAPVSAPRLVGDRLSMDGARILVIEDDDAVIELLEMALEARGASVVSVKARADLPRALQSGVFDAALLDMSPLLGDVDGAVAELRRASPAARLVVMSGSVPNAGIGGGSVWVRKPFEVRESVEALGGDAGVKR